MAEFVEKRCEDMLPELQQMKRIKLFDRNEIQDIAKKLKSFEYKIQRYTKCKEDYLRYIQYEMDLLKLVKQRRDKFDIVQKKSDIDYAIANKINRLYKDAIFKFQDDIRLWIAYIKFCKHVHFHANVSRMMERMLQIHKENPKCWHIAARWEIEENNNKQTARQFLLRGLHIHPTSQLLFMDAFKLELDDTLSNDENSQNMNETTSPTDDDDMPLPLRRAYVIYEEANKSIKDIKFIIELFYIIKEFKNVEKLQKKIISDMIQQYAHEPLMWDTMARRELQGLAQPLTFDDLDNDNDNLKQRSLRDRITSCNKVYQMAIKVIKTEEMWSLYIDCLLEIDRSTENLPNLKRKLLKRAFAQGHQAKKLKEKHYLHWINLLSIDKKNETALKKLSEILSSVTDILPDSVNLWQARLRFLLISKHEEAASVFTKATQILGEKAIPLWRMQLLHVQAESPEKTEEVFKAALQTNSNVAKDMKPVYIEWLVLTKGIEAARKVYKDLCLQPPSCLELHKKMATLELVQLEISVKNARYPHEVATLQFGKNNFRVWLDHIIFEMKHGDPNKVGEIYTRAVNTLEAALTDPFISEYSLIKAKPDLINTLV